MPIETYEVREGQRVEVPSGATPPGAGDQSDAAGAGTTGVPGATATPPAGETQPSDSPPETPSPGAGEAPGDPDDEDEPLRDESEINAERLNRRFKRLTAQRRSAERSLEVLRAENIMRKHENELLVKLLQGAAPALPDTPPQPAGPPQAEQYASHEDYVLAAARYGAQQEFQVRDQQTAQERQQAQQVAFQQQLLEREQAFKQAHPDFDTVVRSGLAGKVSPVLQQALMLVPDGPAVAYALATQPDLVQRLNALPPPLVLVELGRLSGPPGAGTPPPVGERAHAGAPGSTTNGTAPPALPTPPTPLSGSGAGAPTGTYHEGMDQEAYRAWRKRTSTLPTWKER